MPPVFLFPRAIVLDCGARRTALGVFRWKSSRLHLDHHAAVEFPVSPGGEDPWLENTRAALQSLRHRTRVRGAVVLVLPAHLTLTKLIKVPRVDPAQREKIIRFEAGQNIPYALADVVWGSVVAGENSSDLEILLAAAKLDLVERLCAAAQEADFEPDLVLPSALGTLAGFRLVPAHRVKSSLVLNLGARSTTLLLVAPERFMMRTFSSGGNGTTPPLAVERDGGPGGMLASKPAGDGASRNPDDPAPVKTRLWQEIHRTVLNFRAQGGMEEPERVFLWGERADLPGLDETLAAKLQIPVERLDLAGAIGIAGSATGYAPELAGLVGAAAARLRPDQQLIDLLPSHRRDLIAARRRQPWLVATALLALAVPLPPLVHFHKLAAEAERKTAAIERAIDPLRQRDLRNRAAQQRLDGLKEQIARLEGVQDRRTSWVAFFGDLQDRLARVEDVWLERLRVVPEAPGKPLRLFLAGRMLERSNPLAKASPATFNRVKTLLASLADSPFAAAIEAERFDNSQPGVLQFEFVLVANPQRPL